MGKPVNTSGWVVRILFLAVALILVCACLSFAERYFMVYPTPENQSAFYKTYDPDPRPQAFHQYSSCRQRGRIERR
jgi:hypothetical protein